MGRLDYRNQIKAWAREIGFDRCGIAPATRLPRGDYLRAWLASGRAGSMDYLHRYFEQRTNPDKLLPGGRSVIVVALNYHQPRPDPPPDESRCGRVASYAWGDDYHKVMKRKLFELADRMRSAWGEGIETRACVDTAPLLEREAAAAAGVGWIGKNTMVLHPELGSYFFLGEILTTLAIEPDEPVADHCGTCTACLDACPTDAFPAAYEMDASRCISYLTIEHRGEVPEELKSQMGDWVFGCDICQEVCPHNRKAPETTEPRFAVRPPGPTPKLDEIASWTEDEYRRVMQGHAGKRAKLDMWQRNAAIARENQRRSKGTGQSLSRNDSR